MVVYLLVLLVYRTQVEVVVVGGTILEESESGRLRNCHHQVSHN